jgi:hypothetical protein
MAIVGVGRSIYEGTLLGRWSVSPAASSTPSASSKRSPAGKACSNSTEFEDRVRQILRESRIPVGIYVDKELETIDNVVVPLFGSG